LIVRAKLTGRKAELAWPELFPAQPSLGHETGRRRGIRYLEEAAGMRYFLDRRNAICKYICMMIGLDIISIRLAGTVLACRARI
jgi:hypothetical protein